MLVSSEELSSPPLAIDVSNDYFLASLMDGGLVVRRVCVGEEVAVVAVGDMHDHSKAVVSSCFSPGGELIASCSYDKTVVLYRRRPAVGTAHDVFEKVLVVRHATTPESLVFCRSPTASPRVGAACGGGDGEIGFVLGNSH